MSRYLQASCVEDLGLHLEDYATNCTHGVGDLIKKHIPQNMLKILGTWSIHLCYKLIYIIQILLCLNSHLIFEINLEYQVQLSFILHIRNICYGAICNLSYHILCFRIIHLVLYRKHISTIRSVTESICTTSWKLITEGPLDISNVSHYTPLITFSLLTQPYSKQIQYQ